jgi:Sec-independent protein translocase protein TatA
MFGLSAAEILVIALIALILFGNEKLPQNIKKLIKGTGEAKKAVHQVQRSWYDVKSDIMKSIDLEETKNLSHSDAAQSSLSNSLPLINTPKVQTVAQEDIDEAQKNIYENVK